MRLFILFVKKGNRGRSPTFSYLVVLKMVMKAKAQFRVIAGFRCIKSVLKRRIEGKAQLQAIVGG